MNIFKLNTEERNRILNLHESVREKTIKKIILEAGLYEDGGIPVTKNYSAEDIQNWLNTNKQSGLVVDDNIGPKTIAAITASLGFSTPTSTTNTNTVAPGTTGTTTVATQPTEVTPQKTDLGSEKKNPTGNDPSMDV